MPSPSSVTSPVRAATPSPNQRFGSGMAELLVEEGQFLGENVVVDEVRGLVGASRVGVLSEPAFVHEVKRFARGVEERVGGGADHGSGGDQRGEKMIRSPFRPFGGWRVDGIDGQPIARARLEQTPPERAEPGIPVEGSRAA